MIVEYMINRYPKYKRPYRLMIHLILYLSYSLLLIAPQLQEKGPARLVLPLQGLIAMVKIQEIMGGSLVKQGLTKEVFHLQVVVDHLQAVVALNHLQAVVALNHLQVHQVHQVVDHLRVHQVVGHLLVHQVVAVYQVYLAAHQVHQVDQVRVQVAQAVVLVAQAVVH